MHPNAFLKTFWRREFKAQVFVAMSFADEMKQRFVDVIEPAINRVEHEGSALTAFRVDNSKTGDSILTDIIDGIAHSLLVLADVSTQGRDAATDLAYRNGNVMYEVGVALACRQSSEMLLMRDDDDKFLFDVSVIPHLKLDFRDKGAATEILAEALRSRLQETQRVQDARVATAIATMTTAEHAILSHLARQGSGKTLTLSKESLVTRQALARLLDKQLIRTVGIRKYDDGERTAVTVTAMGHETAARLPTLVQPGNLPKPNET